MSAISYKRSEYYEIVGTIKPLLTLHWDEIALNKDVVPLDVDYGVYEALNKLNMLRIYTVWSASSLIGYAIYFLRKHPHYQSTKSAINDIYWIKPEHRNAGIGVGLFKFCEEQLRSELEPGELMVMHTNSKVQFPQAHKVLEFLGHNMVEVGHQKVIYGV